MMSIPYQKCCENFAKTFQAMIQEMFLIGFLITFREISWQGFGIIFLHSQFYKKNISMKSFLNLFVIFDEMFL